jgi:hypothetical protein
MALRILSALATSSFVISGEAFLLNQSMSSLLNGWLFIVSPWGGILLGLCYSKDMIAFDCPYCGTPVPHHRLNLIYKTASCYGCPRVILIKTRPKEPPVASPRGGESLGRDSRSSFSDMIGLCMVLLIGLGALVMASNHRSRGWSPPTRSYQEAKKKRRNGDNAIMRHILFRPMPRMPN